MARPGTTSDKLKVFISYSRKDMASANAIADALQSNGMDILIDRRNLPYGELWQAELADLIRNADAVIWLVSQASIISRWCNWELGEVMRLHKRLIPVAIEAVSTKDLPEAIGAVQLLPHEGTFSLAAHIATLQFVLETDSAWLKEHTRLADHARQWIAKNRNPALLLRGAALGDAQAWLDRRRASAPMPDAETLELILASRRATARRRYWYAASPFVAVVTTLALYIAVMMLGSKSMPDTAFALGDVRAPDGQYGFEQSFIGCKLSCILARFDQPCVAISYDRSIDAPFSKLQTESGNGQAVEVRKRRCYPKFAVDFYWNPSKTADVAIDTEIFPDFTSRPPELTNSPYSMKWYRRLAGDPVDLADVLGLGGDSLYDRDPQTDSSSFIMTGARCQQTCLDLGAKCKGFSYTSVLNRCELYKSVRGLLRDSTTGKIVFMPNTISACDDPNAAIDPDTKATECPPRAISR